jgi:hypothetical protein
MAHDIIEVDDEVMCIRICGLLRLADQSTL